MRDSQAHILSQKEDISKGKFSFVTETYDTYEICFASFVPPRKFFTLICGVSLFFLYFLILENIIFFTLFPFKQFYLQFYFSLAYQISFILCLHSQFVFVLDLWFNFIPSFWNFDRIVFLYLQINEVFGKKYPL